MINQAKKIKFSLLFILGSLIFTSWTGSRFVLAQTTNRVGLVVQFDENTVVTQCVEFSEASITGYQVLERSGLSIEAEFSPQGAAICKIENQGCPADNCLLCDFPNYWAYWHLNQGSWFYSPIGASNYDVHDGDVEGWRWGVGGTPSEAPSFDEICVATEPPTATFTATPTNTQTPTHTATSAPTATKRPNRTRAPNTATPRPTATSNSAGPTVISSPTFTPAPPSPTRPLPSRTASRTLVLDTAPSTSTLIPTPNGMLSQTPTASETVITQPKSDKLESALSPTPEKRKPKPTATPTGWRGFSKAAGTPVAQAIAPTTASVQMEYEPERNITKFALLAGGAIGYIAFMTLFGGLGLALIVLVIKRR